MSEHIKPNWQSFLEVMMVIFSTVGTTILLYIHSDAKMEEHRKETTAVITSIRDEMKDFHGRLCAIEERNRK